MWYFKVLVRAFSTLLLSVILFTILGRNQYAYEHAAIFLELASGRSNAEALTVVTLCGFYLLILSWTLTATVATAVVDAHDVDSRRRLGFVLLLSFSAGILPLLGVLTTLHRIRHSYLADPVALQLSTFCWYGLIAILLTFPAGALAGAWYINRYRRFPRLFRSRRFLIALLIPVAAAFISIYVGVFVSVADMTFGAEGTRGVLSSRYIGLPALVSRFGFITYLVVFVAMFVLITRLIQRGGRAFNQSVVVVLLGCAIVAYLVKPSGTYPVALFTDEATKIYLTKHNATRRSEEYRRIYRERWAQVAAQAESNRAPPSVKLPVIDPSLRTEALLRARGIPSLPAAFAEWLKIRVAGRDTSGVDEHEFPVFIVAAQGGGYYAAYHAALTLSRLQDLCPSFRNQVFAISGVSGGSLGASVFAAISDNIPADFAQHPCASPSTPGRYEAVAREFFSQDLISPLLTTFLYVDLPAAILPVPNRYLPLRPMPYNRVDALETSFEDAFERAKEPGWKNPLRAPFFSHWNASSASPAMILNGTLVWRSTPFLVGQIYFSGKTVDRSLDRLVSDSIKKKLEDHFQMDMEAILEDPDRKKYAYDELNKQLGEDQTRRIVGGQEYFDSLHLLEFAPDVNLKLSSAVAISARFPYITPTALVAGSVLASPDQMRLGHAIQVVDGAYWDNSGLRTALDMLSELEASQATWKIPGVRVTFHILSFGEALELSPAGIDQAKGAPEILAPLQTMLEVRGRAQEGSWFSVLRAKKQPVRFSLFDVKFSAPLDWSASAVTRTSIEQRSGFAHLRLIDKDSVCCNKRGKYYPNWTSQGQVVTLIQTTWSPAGAREACLQTVGEPDGKIAACGKLIANNPNDAAAYERRATAFAIKKDYESAIADAEELIKLDPRISTSHNLAARLYLSKGDTGGAIAELTKAIELEPNRPTYYHNRAVSRIKAGDYSNALIDDRMSVQLSTLDETSNSGQPGRNTAIANGNLAWSAVLARSFPEALDAGKRAVVLAPDLLWLKGNLAHALLFSGRAEEAKRIYLDNKGKSLSNGTLWDKAIHDDFAVFARTGLDKMVLPTLKEIDTALGFPRP